MKAGLSTKILALGLCAALAVNGNVWSFAAEAVGISKEADQNAPATQSEEENGGGGSTQESTEGESAQTDDGSSDSGQNNESSGSENGGDGTQTDNGSDENGGNETGDGAEGTGDGNETGDGTEGTGDGSETGDGTEGTEDGSQTGDDTEGTGDGNETGDGTEGTGDGNETGDGTEGTGDGNETGDGSEGEDGAVSDNDSSDENQDEDKNDGSDVSGNDGQDDEKEDVSGNDPSADVSGNDPSGNGISENGTLGEKRPRMEKVLEDGTRVIVIYSETDEALKDSELEVIPITEGEDYDKIAEQIAAAGSDASEFRSYDIYFTKDGEEVEPDEEVEVTFEFPNGGIEVSTGEEETEETEGLSVTVGETQPKRMMAASMMAKQEEEESQAGKMKVYHFEDGIDKAPVSMESEIQESDGKVTSVSFNTESFSIYVIVKNEWSSNDFSIEIKDLDNNDLHPAINEISLTENQEVDLTKLSDDKRGWDQLASIKVGEGENEKVYTFSHATVKNSWGNETEIIGIKYAYQYRWYQVQYQYQYTDYWGDIQTEWSDLEYKTITFYYAEKLETVETIDNTEHGITMEIFDYDGMRNTAKDQDGVQHNVMGAINYEEGDGENKGRVAIDMLSHTFGEDGFPQVIYNDNSDNDPPFSRLFKENYDSNGNGKHDDIGDVEKWDANHLLQFDPVTGYYSYSSFENYAYFDKTTGDFKVYKDALGTPSEENAYFYQRGNFLPFNDIKPGRFSKNKNLYDKYGAELVDSDWGKKLYKPTGEIDYNFGMHVGAKFSQPKNGLVNEMAMTYEFTGDDDLWIYIDGVLVLDMGGVHDARNGSINFATGEIKIDKIKNADESYYRKNPDGSYTTTIKKMFEKAEKSTEGFEGNTFKNFTNHTFDMFYMERGAGASNLEMKFNLPIIPADTVIVEKQLEETDKDKYANVEFEFQLYVQEHVPDSDDEFVEGKYILYTEGMAKENGVKHILANDTEDPKGLQWRKNDKGEDVFVLKCDEEAHFQNLLANREYKVVECGVKTDEYDTIEITDTETIDWGEGGAIGGTKNAESSIMTVDERGRIVFVNHCSAANSRELWIEKKMAEGQDSNGETFKIHLDLESTNGELVPYVGNYYIVDGEPIWTDDGTITLKEGETAKITQILSGTEFQVYEVIDSSSQFSSDYKIEFFEGTIDSEEFKSYNTRIDEVPNGFDKAIGEILLGNNSKVIVTNSRKGGELAITKAIDGFEAEEDKDTRQFYFKITPLTVTDGSTEITLNEKEYTQVVGEYGDSDATPYNKSIIFDANMQPNTQYYVPMTEDDSSVATEKNIFQKIASFFTSEKQALDEAKNTAAPQEASYLQLPEGFYLVEEVLPDDSYVCHLGDAGSDEKYWKVVEMKAGEEPKQVDFFNELQKNDGQLKITKHVDKVDAVHGDAVFQFKITNTETQQVWYRTISFSEDIVNGATKSAELLTGLPYGTYEVEELDTLRYTCKGEVKRKIEIDSSELKDVRFENEKTFDNNFSHADVMENSFTVNDDGSLSIEQKLAPGETVTE